MDTAAAASWGLLAPASSPPLRVRQAPKRKATLARSTSRLRLHCLPHGKVIHWQAAAAAAAACVFHPFLSLHRSGLATDRPLVCFLLARVLACAAGHGELAAAEAGGGVAVGRRLGSRTYESLARSDTVEAPAALAVTGEEDIDLLGILPPIAAFSFFYFLVAPPLIMNWLRTRWYKRDFVETYLHFMFTYLFYPAMMFWAPFINYRKFPRDPTMKYPWSKPKEGTPLFKDRYPPIDS
ncbi:hypothetical protein PVAP13_2NG320303 [Panicum virgatum]|uniref:Uncharacterized protein n=1 Tax=Panicum virgatum TaxID=38727 RepID=A0A8T0VFA0_PANVG|nr:hypothetical protein PVAP13_2NG320303 [Panicum virgatum]